MDVRRAQIEFGNWRDMCYNKMKALCANEICKASFICQASGRFPKTLASVFGRKPERECFPRQTDKHGLWGNAKSAAQVAGFALKAERVSALSALSMDSLDIGRRQRPVGGMAGYDVLRGDRRAFGRGQIDHCAGGRKADRRALPGHRRDVPRGGPVHFGAWSGPVGRRRGRKARAGRGSAGRLRVGAAKGILGRAGRFGGNPEARGFLRRLQGFGGATGAHAHGGDAAADREGAFGGHGRA